MKYILLLLLLIITGCASYTISKQSLVEQLQENESTNKTRNVASVGTAYTSNNLSKIKCFDKNGKEVLINADKNTTFAITNANTGKTVTLYFDTVYLSNDSIIGLKSRIVGGKSSTALNDISSIQVKTEN
jgi:uncharacterized protein YxeA